MRIWIGILFSVALFAICVSKILNRLMALKIRHNFNENSFFVVTRVDQLGNGQR